MSQECDYWLIAARGRRENRAPVTAITIRITPAQYKYTMRNPGGSNGEATHRSSRRPVQMGIRSRRRRHQWLFYVNSQSSNLDPKVDSAMDEAKAVREIAKGLGQLSVALRQIYDVLEEIKRSLPAKV